MCRQEVYSYYPELNNYLINGIQIKRRNSDGKTMQHCILENFISQDF